MVNLDQVKKLLKKAIETNDEELIALANSLLTTNTETEKQETAEEANSNFIFTMSNSEREKSNRGIPVNKITDRKNQFSDDGIEAKDIVTPSIKPTERKRPPFKTIEQTCEKCNKTFKIHPTHKREFFVCDRCLAK